MTPDAIRAALVTAMDHSTAPMVLSDPHQPDMPMVAANQAFVDLTRYPREALLGRNCRFLQGPGTDPTAAPRIRACIDAGQASIEWILNYRADGSKFWNLLFISPVRDSTGAIAFYFGNQCDITTGFPDWLPDVSFGRAHLVPKLEQEFHALLAEVDAATRADALNRIVTAARRLAEISVALAPGSLPVPAVKASA
jgi:PAS domain S-box-containing protein